MALYHLSLKTISRADGKSAIASAAYRNGKEMYDEMDGKVKDYGNKDRIYHSEVIAPEGAPTWAHDSNKLWNAVEQKETNKNGSLKKKARLAYEIEIGLQNELSIDENIEMTKQWIKDNFTERGFVAEVSFHNMEDSENPHAHIMFATRSITENGFDKKIDRDTFMKREFLEQTIRPSWENKINETFKNNEIDKEVTSKSFKKQGITDRKPQIHLGHKVHNALLNDRGFELDRAQQFFEIEKFNEISQEVNRLKEQKKDVSVAPKQPEVVNQVEQESKPVKKDLTDSNPVKNDILTESKPAPSFKDQLLQLSSESSELSSRVFKLQQARQSKERQLDKEGMYMSEIRLLESRESDLKSIPSWRRTREEKAQLKSIESQLIKAKENRDSFLEQKPQLQREILELKEQEDKIRMQQKDLSAKERKFKEDNKPKSKSKSRSKNAGMQV